jgi:hypothetical protein
MFSSFTKMLNMAWPEVLMACLFSNHISDCLSPAFFPSLYLGMPKWPELAYAKHIPLCILTETDFLKLQKAHDFAEDSTAVSSTSDSSILTETDVLKLQKSAVSSIARGSHGLPIIF